MAEEQLNPSENEETSAPEADEALPDTPGMAGRETAEKIQARRRRRNIAAIVLSSGAFLGISLSISQKANAQYASLCDLSYENGPMVMSCTESNTQDCEVRLILISPTHDTTAVLKFRCNGETVKSENDHLIFNPIAH